MRLHVIWKTPTSFAVFEIVVVSLFLVTCWHATQMPRSQRAELLTALLYALLFEELDIRLFKTYHYGEGYVLMLGHVPLVIVLAWAVIICTSMYISDCWPISAPAKACCDALLALLIDLSIDAIAIRRGYWQWTIPLNAGWFGVPADNLSAWMFVIFFFSLLCRLIRRLSAQHIGPCFTSPCWCLRWHTWSCCSALWRLGPSTPSCSLMKTPNCTARCRGGGFARDMPPRSCQEQGTLPDGHCTHHRVHTPGPAWVLRPRIARQRALSRSPAAPDSCSQRPAP